MLEGVLARGTPIFRQDRRFLSMDRQDMRADTVQANPSEAMVDPVRPRGVNALGPCSSRLYKHGGLSLREMRLIPWVLLEARPA